MGSKMANGSSETRWQEIFEGGSPEAEREIFLSLAEEILRVQETNRERSGGAWPMRTLHAKQVVGVTNAFLAVDQSLPSDFVVGHFQPGATLGVRVRFSNASGVPQTDVAPDMRGAALRITTPQGAIHDLLMTSFPVSHARDARQFVEFAVIASGDRETLLARLVEKFGLEEAQRMGANVRQGVRLCASFALETFWSRGAVLWGDEPVRFQLRPGPDAAPAPKGDGDDALAIEFAARLAAAPVRFRLALQRYVDERRTPIEDGAVEWIEDVSPPIEIATLEIPQQDLSSPEVRQQAAQMDGTAFNPWNAPEAFRPLGNLNRARGIVYQKSAARWMSEEPAD